MTATRSQNESRRWVPYRNLATETVPPYGVMQVVRSVHARDGTVVLEIDRPGAVSTIQYYVNGPSAVAPNHFGMATADWPARARWSGGAAPQVSGTPWGPKAGSWDLFAGLEGFQILGDVTEVDANHKTVMVHGYPLVPSPRCTACTASGLSQSVQVEIAGVANMPTPPAPPPGVTDPRVPCSLCGNVNGTFLLSLASTAGGRPWYGVQAYWGYPYWGYYGAYRWGWYYGGGYSFGAESALNFRPDPAECLWTGSAVAGPCTTAETQNPYASTFKIHFDVKYQQQLDVTLLRVIAESLPGQFAFLVWEKTLPGILECDDFLALDETLDPKEGFQSICDGGTVGSGSPSSARVTVM